MLEMSHSTLVFEPNFILIVLRFKRNQLNCNFYYAAMPMMTSQKLNSVDFTKTKKPRYLEKETLFFLQLKKIINYTPRVTLDKK